MNKLDIAAAAAGSPTQPSRTVPSTTHINAIPADALRLMLDCLSFSELTQARLVCRKWSTLHDLKKIQKTRFEAVADTFEAMPVSTQVVSYLTYEPHLLARTIRNAANSFDLKTLKR